MVIKRASKYIALLCLLVLAYAFFPKLTYQNFDRSLQEEFDRESLVEKLQNSGFDIYERKGGVWSSKVFVDSAGSEGESYKNLYQDNNIDIPPAIYFTRKNEIEQLCSVDGCDLVYGRKIQKLPIGLLAHTYTYIWSIEKIGSETRADLIKEVLLFRGNL